MKDGPKKSGCIFIKHPATATQSTTYLTKYSKRNTLLWSSSNFKNPIGPNQYWNLSEMRSTSNGRRHQNTKLGISWPPSGRPWPPPAGRRPVLAWPPRWRPLTPEVLPYYSIDDMANQYENCRNHPQHTTKIINCHC